jgi:hypothetical protein
MSIKDEFRQHPLAAIAALVVILGALFGAINWATPYLRKLHDAYFVAAGYFTSICILVVLRYPLRHFFPRVDVVKHDAPTQGIIMPSIYGGGCFWDGKLVQPRGSSKVYFVRSRTLHHLTDWNHVGHLGLSAEDVYAIPPREIEAMPEGSSIRDTKSADVLCSGWPRPKSEWEGRAIRAKDEKTVWIVKGGKRHALHDWKYVSYAGFGPGVCFDIPHKEVYAVPEGEPIDTPEKGKTLV